MDGPTITMDGIIVQKSHHNRATKGAIEWTITPYTIKDWKYDPVIQVSQLGYHPEQEKKAIVELDAGNNPALQI